MPVIVETDVKPSKRRYWLLSLPLLSGAYLLYYFHVSFWLLAIWLSALIPLIAVLRSEYQATHLRFSGSELLIWQAEEVSAWEWAGEGRLSYSFIEFHLKDKEEQSMRLRVWRDSLTDPSWRALKMAFRVNQPEARRDAQPLDV